MVTSWSPIFHSGQSNCFQPLLTGHISSPVTSCVDLLWMLARTLTSFLCCKAKNSTKCHTQICTNAKYFGKITYFDHLTMVCLILRTANSFINYTNRKIRCSQTYVYLILRFQNLSSDLVSVVANRQGIQRLCPV